MLAVKVSNAGGGCMPSSESRGASGYDLYACEPSAFTLQPCQRRTFWTGVGLPWRDWCRANQPRTRRV
jgi:dUTPase